LGHHWVLIVKSASKAKDGNKATIRVQSHLKRSFETCAKTCEQNLLLAKVVQWKLLGQDLIYSKKGLPKAGEEKKLRLLNCNNR